MFSSKDTHILIPVTYVIVNYKVKILIKFDYFKINFHLLKEAIK